MLNNLIMFESGWLRKRLIRKNDLFSPEKKQSRLTWKV